MILCRWCEEEIRPLGGGYWTTDDVTPVCRKATTLEQAERGEFELHQPVLVAEVER